MKKTKKIVKFIIIFIIAVYIILTFSNQQRTLNQYSKNYEELTSQMMVREL